jgi:Ni,Fe-hydrogenase maturation factor
MRFLVVGNTIYKPDSSAVNLIPLLSERFPEHEFVHFDPNEGIDCDELYIIDVVKGIKEPVILTEKDVEKLKDFPKVSAHDFDLGFMIKLYIMLGKIRKVRIVGIPEILNEDAFTKTCSLIKNIA